MEEIQQLRVKCNVMCDLKTLWKSYNREFVTISTKCSFLILGSKAPAVEIECLIGALIKSLKSNLKAQKCCFHQ